MKTVGKSSLQSSPDDGVDLQPCSIVIAAVVNLSQSPDVELGGFERLVGIEQDLLSKDGHAPDPVVDRDENQLQDEDQVRNGERIGAHVESVVVEVAHHGPDHRRWESRDMDDVLQLSVSWDDANGLCNKETHLVGHHPATKNL